MATISISAMIIYALSALGAGTALGAAAYKTGEAIGNTVADNEREAQEPTTEQKTEAGTKEHWWGTERENWWESETTSPNNGTNQKNEEEKDPIPPTTGTTTEITDKTNENIKIPINGIDMESWLAAMRKDREERWAREDAIRKETQEREDTAYQRAVKDAISAGINPNLINLTPAASGGGITQASKMDDSELTAMLEEALKYIEQEFKGDENSKDRWANAISTIATIAALLFTKKKK